MAETIKQKAIEQSEVEKQLEELGVNAISAAEMLITPLNLGVKDLQNLRNQEPFNRLPEASFNRARGLYAKMRDFFGKRLEQDNQEAQSTRDSNMELARKNAMSQLGDLKISIDDRMPLSDYLRKNFSNQLSGIDKWSEQFYKAYRVGSMDIRGTALVGHLNPQQRENIARIYDQVYPFLLGQDFGAKATVMNVYGYRKARDIGRCLAHFCTQGVKRIEPDMLSLSINGKSLDRLGIQDDVEKFSGEYLYEQASLKKLNAFYQEFLETNEQAKLALGGKEVNHDSLAYQTLTSRRELGNRPFKSSKEGETMAEFEKRMAATREKNIASKYRKAIEEKRINGTV